MRTLIFHVVGSLIISSEAEAGNNFRWSQVLGLSAHPHLCLCNMTQVPDDRNGNREQRATPPPEAEALLASCCGCVRSFLSESRLHTHTALPPGRLTLAYSHETEKMEMWAARASIFHPPPQAARNPSALATLLNLGPSLAPRAIAHIAVDMKENRASG